MRKGSQDREIAEMILKNNRRLFRAKRLEDLKIGRFGLES
jgi:hypothetical protein